MNAKVLELAPPAIYAYNQYASLFSLISGDENAWEWIFSNFINLQYYEEKDSDLKVLFFDKYHLTFQLCPFVTTYKLPRFMMIDQFKTLIDFIVYSINHSFSVYTQVDHFYLPQSKHYQNRTRWHEIFIFGYDLDKGKIYISDNIDHGRYVRTTCDFHDFEKAFYSIDIEQAYYSDIFMIRKDGGWFDFKIEEIIYSLENYLTSRGAVGTFFGPSKHTYGMDCIRLMIDFANQERIDRRAFHLLWEHKELMIRRIEFLATKGFIFQTEAQSLLENYKQIVQDALVARTLALKYLIKKDKDTLKRIEKKLKDIIKNETIILSELLDALKSCNHS